MHAVYRLGLPIRSSPKRNQFGRRHRLLLRERHASPVNSGGQAYLAQLVSVPKNHGLQVGQRFLPPQALVPGNCLGDPFDFARREIGGVKKLSGVAGANLDSSLITP